MTSEEFPHLNDETRDIFEKFVEIYSKEVLENGREEVKRICEEYKQSQGQELDNGNLQQQQQIR